ncbi:VPA1262 family N-terminal domain-containing protein, partial [Nostoc sp. NIES-2111]
MPYGEAKRFFSIILNELQEQSGLGMDDQDAGRLGNIELLHWTNCDVQGRCWIDYATHKEGDTCTKVDFWIKDCIDLPSTVSLLVRCCLYNENEIAADHLMEVAPPLAGKKLQFQANQQLTNIQVTVWVKHEEASWIIYDRGTTLMRSISMSISFGGSKYNLDKLRLPKDQHYDSELLKSFSNFSRVSRERTPLEIGGYESDPWIPIVRSKRLQLRQALPRESKGMYFKRGWDTTKIENSDVLFYDWIRSVIEKSSGDIFLVDPFFDVDALDLIVRLRELSFNKLSIVCCTQANSKPAGNDEIMDKTKSARKEAMLNYLERNAAIVSGIPLYIYDLTNTPIKTDQHFHDRYLIILNETGATGYNLSNSIQGATKRVPLLVTEISTDVLPEVIYYVHSLIDQENTEEDRGYSVQEMFKPQKYPPQKDFERSLSAQAWQYDRSKLAAALLVSEDIFQQDQKYVISYAQFINLLNTLATSSQKNANILLDGIGYALAHGLFKLDSWPSGEDRFN